MHNGKNSRVQKNANGGGEASGSGRGGRGGRGRGRGRGRGGHNDAARAPKFGDRIILSSVDAGFVPPPSSGGGGRRGNVQTGTEEILGYISDPENNKPRARERERSTKSKTAIIAPPSEDERSPSPMDCDVPSEDIGGQICVLKQRPNLVNRDDGAFLNDGYKDIWTDALTNEVTKMKGSFDTVRDKPYSVIPIPRAQPAHYLNKFTANKIPLREPCFKVITMRPPTTFTKQSIDAQFHGTTACSKVAGRTLTGILEKPHLYKSLFSIQLPNSLRSFTSMNKDTIDEDIRVSDLNVGLNDEETPATIKGVKQEAVKHRYHCLAGFASDKPFGKLQLLKSGRVVLRVGHRVFDVCSTSNNRESQVGAIFELDASEEGPKSSVLGVSRARPVDVEMASTPTDQIHMLGKVEHYFSAYYDYEKIFEELDTKKKAGNVE
uniref:RNA polymerase III Rpc4 n=1 Tax=Panagrellus redivivus TaxID=6233 RepID=A0A7E4UQ87_PANRE